jgi:hypothetical protein
MSRTLTDVIDALNRAPLVSNEMREEVATGGLALVRGEFASSTDPYGARWAPLKNDRGPRLGGPLLKTGALRDSAGAQPIANGVQFELGASYAGFQQNGTKTIEPRTILPRAGRDLPRPWVDLIASAFAHAWKRVVGL